jgi:Zn finger protein HypA/HybF involved in hydrogenase expression
MELLTEKLPSGYRYNFISLHLMPMTFAQILEYMENVPENEVEKLYFDYKLVLQDDPNVDNLLYCDLYYIIFLKKCISISKDEEYKLSVTCPVCHKDIKAKVKLSEIEFNKLDRQFINGVSVNFSGGYRDIKMPTVSEFMRIFSKYRMYKKISDLRIIRLISLFAESSTYLQRVETQVVNATYKDIAMLTMLDKLYFELIKPININCPHCEDEFNANKEKEIASMIDNEKSEAEINEVRNSNYGGIAVGIDSLIVNFFRDIIENNKLTDNEIVFRQVR